VFEGKEAQVKYRRRTRKQVPEKDEERASGVTPVEGDTEPEGTARRHRGVWSTHEWSFTIRSGRD
jgi:hypothetical protein